MNAQTDAAGGKQSRRMSLIEAITNVSVGFCVALLTQILVFPLFGLQVTARKLEAIGITTIGALRAFPEPDLVARFGKFGRWLARFARGEDDREVVADRPAKSSSAATP